MKQLVKKLKEVCNTITVLTNEQKQTCAELLNIKQQNAQLGSKMEDINTMLLAVFKHVVGQILNNAQPVSQSQPSLQNAQQRSSLQSAAAATDTTTMSESARATVDVTDDSESEARKKFVTQSHPKAFNLQQATEQLAIQVAPGISITR